MKTPYKFVLLALMAVSFFYGCKKDSSQKPINPIKKVITTAVSDSMVLTPGGWLPKSHVFLVEKGYHLDVSTGHVLKVEDVSGKVVADFGIKNVVSTTTSNPKGLQLNSMPSLGNTKSLNTPYPTNGWTGFAQWYSFPGPITYFSTNWVVPGNPTNTSGNQTIFIFNATENIQLNNQNQITYADILQPVLQWGPSRSGGGNYWSIASWYGWNNGQYFAATTTTNVSVGATLQGIINYTGSQSDGSYNYTCFFQGIGNVLTVVEGNSNSSGTPYPYISDENNAYETLESYNNNNNGVATSTDYPSQADVKMTGINIQTGSVPPTVSWSRATGQYANVGEHANIISNNSSGTGEVDLYFHPQAPTFTYPNPIIFTQGVPVSPVYPTYTAGNPATSFSISPSLPDNLSFNAATGVISGTPIVSSSATPYTIKGTNATGSGSTTTQLSVNASPTGPYTFEVELNTAATTYFTITVNGENISGNGRGVVGPGTNDISNTNVILLSNSTVVFQVTSGYMPVSASLYGDFSITGVISGNTITFSGVNLSSGNTCQMVLN